DDPRVHVHARLSTEPSYDLVLAPGPAGPPRAKLAPGGLCVLTFVLDQMTERELRAALSELAKRFSALLLTLPEETTLVAIASDSPLRLDPAAIVGALADGHLAASASRAGTRGVADLLARIIGDRELARAVGSERAGAHRANALGLILGAQAARA